VSECVAAIYKQSPPSGGVQDKHLQWRLASGGYVDSTALPRMHINDALRCQGKGCSACESPVCSAASACAACELRCRLLACAAALLPL
jgi:hypothetical protein